MPADSDHPTAAGGPQRPDLEIDLRPRRDEVTPPVREPGDGDRFRDLQADRQALIGQLTRALERAHAAEARVDDLAALLRQCRDRLAPGADDAADADLLRRLDAALSAGRAARD